MSRRSRMNKDIARIARLLSQSRESRAEDVYRISPSAAPVPQGPRAAIFRSEMDYISSCILDCPDIETGGQLFGYWTESGVPVVLYAIGPGRNANHQTTFFNQDVDYLVKVGGELRRLFGLRHIGEWHSHHKLGLARPSGHDAHTMISTIREKELGWFLLCIGNCDRAGERSSLNAFMCDSESCADCGWDLIDAESPVRGDVDRTLGTVLVHPQSSPRHADPRMNGHLVPVSFPRGYWLREEWGRRELQDYIAYIRSSCSRNLDSVSPKVDGKGLAHLVLSGHHRGRTVVEDILFPSLYPQEPPVITVTVDGVRVDSGRARWYTDRRPLDAFRKFFSQSQNI